MGLPATVGRYRVTGLLGTGGFSTVLRARDEALDADVAVKVLADNLAHDPDVRERFVSEARAMRRVTGPTLLPVHDIGQTDDGRPFFVMALADRGTLRDRLDALPEGDGGLRCAPADALAVLDAVADGLERLHDAGLVHRDVKPSNVLLASSPRPDADAADRDLLAPDERVLLGDLGLAKDLRAASGLTLGAGTPGAMAPEQARPAGVVDRRTDLHAASALLVELLTGDPPSHWAPTGDRNAPLSAAQRTVLGSDLGAALAAGLAWEPDDRPPDVATWRAPIAAALASRRRAVDDDPTPVGTGSVAAGPDGVRLRNGWRRIAAAALGVGVVAWAVVVLLAGSARVVVEGPDEVVLGEVARFTAMLDDGLVGHFWTDWEGRRIEGGDLTVRPTSLGELTFRLTGVGPDGAHVTTTRTVAIVAPALSARIEGPDTVVVGERVTYRAVTSGAVGHRWLGPDGTEAEGGDLFVEAVSPGRLRIELVATGADGDTVRVTREVDAVDE